VNQCCGSGSEIQCFFDPWIRDKHPGSSYNFLGWKYLNFVNTVLQIRFRDPWRKNQYPWWKNPDPWWKNSDPWSWTGFKHVSQRRSRKVF
jgi:hypothetical protein